jgi:oxygen-independent coproporphyrinogen-3 oxidase
MFTLTQQIMEARGMPAYEISNHARAGQESCHNLTYWKSDDYIGIGPGAHGRYGVAGKRYATETIKSPERWLEKVEQGDTGLIAETALTERERLEEAVMMGLRLREGIDYADWQERTGLTIKGALTSDVLAKNGFVIADDTHIEVTPKGRLLLNRITAQLLDRIGHKA